MRVGGSMADIYEFVKQSNNSRPLYTSYELSKMVKDKRIDEGSSIPEFAGLFGVPVDELILIEEGNCSFSPKMYRECGNILGLSSQELLAEITDDVSAASFRTTGNDENVQETFSVANKLFNEIIMQKKIGIN